jgi:hypothetical protein
MPARVRWTASLPLTVLFACSQATPREAPQTAAAEAEAARAQPVTQTVEDAATEAADDDAATTEASPCDPNEPPSLLAQKAFEGDVEGARSLIVGEELDASTRSSCAKTPLMMALLPYPEEPGTSATEARYRRSDKLDAAGLFLTRCFNVAGADANGVTALHVAVEAPDREHKLVRLIERMFMCGAPVDPRTNEGATPLLLAVQKKKKAMIDALLGAGADPNVQTNGGLSALMVAELSGDKKLVALLKKPPVRDAGAP